MKLCKQRLPIPRSRETYRRPTKKHVKRRVIQNEETLRDHLATTRQREREFHEFTGGSIALRIPDY
jgi:hypothetical protein